MLDKMNKQMKILLNEASGISSKCKLKLVKLVQKHFLVTLPNDNYLNIDIVILENGDIKMRDVLYKTDSPVSSLEELGERFSLFQKEADALINKNEISFETISTKKDRNNLIWVILITFAIVIIVLNVLRRLLAGDFYSVLWLAIIIGYYIVPATGNSIRNRYIRAYRYLKSIFKK
ncbi:MAG: hypothetical protein IKF71_04070 [Bacilli bacterium]|nr:hypothetical protein [Bacilli bacterium]